MIVDKLPVSLDTDALRSFVLGIECGSFALAAQRLCRSTSAVSAQLKKLEQQCGTALVVKNGRHLVLTPSGEMLISYARRLLALNDEAQLAIKGELLQGEVRLGMQEDFGESAMPEVLGKFSQQHPGVKIYAQVDRNQALLDGMAAGKLDLALLWQPEKALPEYQPIGHCPLEWIHHPDRDIHAYLADGEPLPLVMFDAPCLIRSRAIAALDQAGIPWRIVFSCHSLSGIWAGVQAGLGVTLRTRIGMPETLSVITGILPSPGQLGISLLHKGKTSNAAVQLLQRLMVEKVKTFTLL